MSTVKVADLKLIDELEPGNIIELNQDAIPTAVLIRHLETVIEFSERAFKNTGNVFHEGYNRAFQHMLRDVKEQHFLNYTKQS